MKIAKDKVVDPDVKVIREYARGRIRVNEATLKTSIIVSRTKFEAWQPSSVAALNEHDFDPILALTPEIVLLGTGAQLRFPDPKIGAKVMAAGSGFEVMDTAAACRTFNILISEERQVVAALMMI